MPLNSPAEHIPEFEYRATPDNYIAILDLKSFTVAGQLDVDGWVWSEFLLSRFPVGSSADKIAGPVRDGSRHWHALLLATRKRPRLMLQAPEHYWRHKVLQRNRRSRCGTDLSLGALEIFRHSLQERL
jgi:hypothetical protein